MKNMIKVLEILLLSWITAKRQLIHDNTASRTEFNSEYDFIVVGAGAAACVVASRLAESQRATVLLLEAGGAQDAIYHDIPGLQNDITHKRPDFQWMQYTEPQRYSAKAYPGGRILQTVGKALGGSSTHNALLFNRGNSRGYDEWEYKYGAKGWSFKDVLPFFKRYENNTDKRIVEMNPGYHGTNGPLEVTTTLTIDKNLLKLNQFYHSLGFMDTDVNGANQTGVIIGQSFITTGGLRGSASSAYLDPNPYPNNLHIVTKALVTKILFNGLTAVGVEFAKNDKPFRVMAKKEIIISAGAINTPQILMLSGVGPKDHLSQFKIPVILDLPEGRNYKNHVQLPDVSIHPGPPIRTDILKQIYLNKINPLTIHNNHGLYFSTKSNRDKEWPNGYLFTYPVPKGLVFHPSIFRIRSRGTVRLQSTSPYVQPIIDENAYSDPQDYQTAIESVSFIYYLKEQPSLSSFVIYPSIAKVGCPPCPDLKDSQCIEGIKCVVEKKTRPDCHPSGTCRMGALERSDVVVDPYLRVKNAKRLRVCDASIMPDIPNANLYASALMIGEKCAQIIKDFYHF